MYQIKIDRVAKEGTLTFNSPGTLVTTKCYWDLEKKIPAGSYPNCSATTMARKKNTAGNPREAIFIPNVPGFSGIFIHMGKPPYENWSDGCIVIDEIQMVKIYNAISPKNGHNVTVKITG